MPTNKYSTILSVFILIAAVFYSFYGLMPTKSWEPETVLSGFSIERAYADLEKISQKPHFPGTEEHTTVRNYLKNELEKIGLEVEIQEQVAINKKWRAATTNKNILAKIKGTGGGKSLLLLSHYDSNPHSSLGASDAGSGIVIILEAIRAFQSQGISPQNDIIICFSDAEELGLLGANAFVNYHPWAKNVGLVLNMEARGSGGPSYMLLETNGGNKKLIEAFDKANMSFPQGNSMMYSIYKMLPNDTDLTVFREDGDIDGFNFAFIGDHFDYHTEQDTFERMDKTSFLHQASYLLAGFNYFSNASLDSFKSDMDYVYFNFPMLGMVYYPFSWVLPWTVFCILAFVVLLFLGFRRNELTLSGILSGFLAFGLVLIASGIFAYFGWKLLVKLHPQYKDILHGFTYNGYYYVAFFVAITMAISFWIYNRKWAKSNLKDLMIAPLFIWIVINTGIAYYLTGAGFFIIPVCVMLIELGILIFNKKQHTLLLFTVLAIPILIIFTPMIKMFPVGLGLKMLVASTIFTALLFGFLIPVLKNYGHTKKAAGVFALIGLAFLIVAEMKSDYSEDRKAPNSILYVLDSNSNEAYWRTYNNSMDEFTKQFFNNAAEAGSFYKNGTASKYGTRTRHFAKAPVKNLIKPNIEIITDTIIGKDRNINIRINSKRAANKIELITKAPIKFKGLSVNEIGLEQKPGEDYVLEIEGGSILSYFFTEANEVLKIEFVIDKDQIFDIDILEAKFDLLTNPEFGVKPRSKEMIPMPFVLNDATIIKTTLNL